MSGRGAAVTLKGSSGGADFEVARFNVPYPGNGAVTGLTNIFYVPQDVALGDVVITLSSPSSHTLKFKLLYCRGYPGSTSFSNLSGDMTLSGSAKQAVVSPTWTTDLQAGDYLRLDQVSGDGTDGTYLEIVVLKSE